MSEAVAAESAGSGEHAVTPLELFFDLVFVFSITQVTALLTHDPSWHGVVRGALALAAVWWAWTGYAWLTSTLDVDEGGVRLLVLAATAAMLGLALALPQAFGDDAILFGLSFLAVRVLHVGLYAYAGKDDPDLLHALLRIAPTELIGALLLLAAAFLSGDWRIGVWILALAVDYLGPAVVPLHGWRIAPKHFAERYGLVVLIALGESVIAIGVGAGFELTAPVIGAAALGVVVISALWWLYFDVAAIFARRELVRAQGVAQARLARDAYSYLHLPMVAGIVFFAFALETTLHDITATLDPLPAVALCTGAALYLIAQVAFLWRSTGRVFRRRTLGAALLLALIPAALNLPAVAALAIVSTVCSLVVAYEAIRHREHRSQIRHPELTG
jgi:low temperature requirement protein LtrA